jgi:hypothetical protein
MILKMATIGMVYGLILEGKEENFCVGCAYGKNHKKQFPWNERRKILQLPRDFLHINLCGPMQQTIEGGAHYFVLFCSRMMLLDLD